MLSCSKFLTTSDYAPRLRTRLAVEQQLIHDAIARGWAPRGRTPPSHKHRLEQLLRELDETPRADPRLDTGGTPPRAGHDMPACHRIDSPQGLAHSALST